MLSALRSVARGALRCSSASWPQAACAASAQLPARDWRAVSSSAPRSGIEDFIDPRKPGEYPKAGRGWEASDLRLKSFDDLHKLWYVLLKERNLLQTERAGARTAREKFLNPARLSKVRKSMARIKLVLTERAIAECAGDEEALAIRKAVINQL